MYRRVGLLQECLEEVLYHQDHGSDIDSRSNAFVEHAQKSGSSHDVHVLETWLQEIWETFDGHNLDDAMEKLKGEIKTLPSLILYVPVSFDEPAIEIVGVWSREHVHPQLLLDLQVDPAVIGGCAFVYNDTYHNISFRELMKRHTGLVTELLQSYA